MVRLIYINALFGICDDHMSIDYDISCATCSGPFCFDENTYMFSRLYMKCEVYYSTSIKV